MSTQEQTKACTIEVKTRETTDLIALSVVPGAVKIGDIFRGGETAVENDAQVKTLNGFGDFSSPDDSSPDDSCPDCSSHGLFVPRTVRPWDYSSCALFAQRTVRSSNQNEMNPTSVSEDLYYFNQFQLLLTL